MTKKIVKRKVVKKRPEIPSPRNLQSYGKDKNGKHIIPKFVVSPNGNKYVIVNMKTGDLAENTNSTGYPYKEAIKIATWFLKNKGAYTTSPF